MSNKYLDIAMGMIIKQEVNAVLDKIRAEIENIAFDSQEIDGEHESIIILELNDALEIIDKYKAESEVHCNCTKEEIAKSFIEDVEAVKDLLPRAESEE